jgi:hypothetical protein
VSFTLNKHICNENLFVHSIESNTSCCEKTEEEACDISHNEKNCCDESSSISIINESIDCVDSSYCNAECCVNTNLRVQVFSTDKAVSEKISIKKLPVVQQIHSIVLSHFYSEIKRETVTTFYPPPQLNLNFNILYQVFRI